MLRIDALWLCTQTVDMRAGAESLLAAVVTPLGEARANHGDRDKLTSQPVAGEALVPVSLELRHRTETYAVESSHGNFLTGPQ